MDKDKEERVPLCDKVNITKEQLREHGIITLLSYGSLEILRDCDIPPCTIILER